MFVVTCVSAGNSLQSYFWILFCISLMIVSGKNLVFNSQYSVIYYSLFYRKFDGDFFISENKSLDDMLGDTENNGTDALPLSMIEQIEFIEH